MNDKLPDTEKFAWLGWHFFALGLISSTLCFLGSHFRQTFVPLPAYGTFIVFVPTKDGMTVAAESREQLLNGKYCDGQKKIFALDNHPRAVIAIAGSHSVITAPASSVQNPCAFIANAKDKIDFRAIAKDFLDHTKGPVTVAVVRTLEATLKARLDDLLPTYPGLIQPDGSILVFSFAQYLLQENAIVYDEFKMAPNGQRITRIQSELFKKIHLTDDVTQNTHMNGAGGCFLRAVSVDGRRELGQVYLRVYDKFISQKPAVGQIGRTDGVSLARDLIAATIRYSDMHPNLNCQVGGPLRIFQLDAHPHPIELDNL